MLKFKQFLIYEDIGIGPEGTPLNPSLKNNIAINKNRVKELNDRLKGLPPGSERDAINKELDEVKKNIDNTRLLMTSTKELNKEGLLNAPPTSITPPTITSNGIKMDYDAAKMTLTEPMASTSPDTIPEPSGYKVTTTPNLQGLGGKMNLSNLSIEQLGKTARSYRL